MFLVSMGDACRRLGACKGCHGRQEQANNKQAEDGIFTHDQAGAIILRPFTRIRTGKEPHQSLETSFALLLIR
jgi:cytochrome c553